MINKKETWNRYILIFCKLSFLSFILFGYSDRILSEEKIGNEKKEETPAKKEEPKKWGYVYSNSFEKFSPNYIKKIQKSYDVLCVTGLLFRGTGQLRFENEFINKLDKAGIQFRNREADENKTRAEIYPMVGLSSIKDGINLLKNENPRLKSIENLVQFLKDNEFKGVHLDFEGLPGDYAKMLGDYLKELREELNKNNIKLTFAMFPQVEFSDLKNFHNPKYIEPNVDEIVLMNYDFHNTKTIAGCVTSKNWSVKNLEEILKSFSANKVWLGLPAYGYEWHLESKRVNVVSAREATLLLDQYVYARDESGCVKITKKEKGKNSLIYFSDIETRNSLAESVKKFSLLGSAVWRLGLEED